MRLITIEKSDECISAYDGADRRLTRAWTVRGQVDFYLKGKFDDHDYATAMIMALNICSEMRIPASMLVRVMPTKPKQGRKIDASQKSLF